MAYISLNENLHGMQSLLAYRPEIAPAMTGLMQILIRSNEGLSMGEREMTAAFVSALNNCYGCHQIHGEIAQCLLNDTGNLIEKIKSDYLNAPISERLKALLGIAESVTKNGRSVTEKQIKQAKNLGISDLEIHDTVLIAALFCLFNRYIDGLGIISNDTPESFKERAKIIAEVGYSNSKPQ